MNKKTFKIALISVIIVAAVVLIFFFIKADKNREDEYLKDYGVNEYIPTYISDQDLVKIYLNDYIYNMRYDINTAYNQLDKKYRDAKFDSIDKFIAYISNIGNKSISLKKYSKTSKKGFIIYKAYDNNDNVFIFKTKGIMQYTVYLDEDTVEVGE